MLEQKTTTNEEFEALCAALLPKFNEYLMRHSKNIFSCELATSLEGIKTMPALYDLNGVQKQVIAPLSLLTKDVDAEIAAYKKATKEATTAAAKANDAAASVTKATTDLTVERKKVEDAVSASKMATEAAKNATSDTLASKKAIEQNEATRQSAETGRVKAESARVEVEKKRVTAENARATAENGRVKAETKRETDTRAAITSCKTQTDLAQELNDHPQKQGDNGNWWEWNTTTKQYEDTGVIARGGMMYPTFEILDNELYVTDAGSNIEERIALEDNELILKL
jgi:hypothetical protein